MANRYINPFTDFGFKKLFGEEVNKDLLVDFLNSLLPEKHRIKDLSYKKTDQLGESLVDRRAVFDIYCQSEAGDKFIVELQKAKQNFFKDRSVFYATFPIREQADRGEWNFELAAVYCIGILDFVFEEDKENPDYLHRVQLKDQRNAVFFDKLTFIYLEMPKFEKREDDLETANDRWLYFIKNLSEFDHIPERLRNRIFEKAFQQAEIAQFQPEQREAYEKSLKYYRDIKNVVDTSFGEGFEEGRMTGLEEGKQMGLEEGKQMGLEEGKQMGLEEGKYHEKLSIARNLLSLGFSVEQIAQATGLSLQQVENLH
jgi:predicted transposase/invertase (TIGR01784 family)